MYTEVSTLGLAEEELVMARACAADTESDWWECHMAPVWFSIRMMLGETSCLALPLSLSLSPSISLSTPTGEWIGTEIHDYESRKWLIDSQFWWCIGKFWLTDNYDTMATSSETKTFFIFVFFPLYVFMHVFMHMWVIILVYIKDESTLQNTLKDFDVPVSTFCILFLAKD